MGRAFLSPTPERPLSGRVVAEWFDDVLGRDFNRRPSAETCERIALQTRSVLVIEMDRDLPVEERRWPPFYVREEKWHQLWHQLDASLTALNEFQRTAGADDSYRKHFPLDILETALREIVEQGCTYAKFSRGRRSAEWLSAAWTFVYFVKLAFIRIGIDDGTALDAKNAASLVAAMGGLFVEYVVPGIQPGCGRDTFARQMKGTRRSRSFLREPKSRI